jgi:hypothetical protein
LAGNPIVANVWLVAGGQIKTFVLSHVIKINKELQTSMTHSPARLPQAFVSTSFFSTLESPKTFVQVQCQGILLSTV